LLDVETRQSSIAAVLDPVSDETIEALQQAAVFCRQMDGGQLELELFTREHPMLVASNTPAGHVALSIFTFRAITELL